jgi:hypothetical protein
MIVCVVGPVSGGDGGEEPRGAECGIGDEEGIGWEACAVRGLAGGLSGVDIVVDGPNED